ncbi:uncharacterized protein LOC144651173 [Oculina patagonica]
MEAKQGLILVICSMILAGEVACFPTDVRAKSSFTQDDAAALEKYDDWRSILKKIPNFLFPILRKILKGIANSEDPMDILLSILGEDSKKKKNKKNKKNKKGRKNKNKKENNENENNENKEEEPKPEENAESEKPEKESQEDMKQSDKHQINGPQDW